MLGSIDTHVIESQTNLDSHADKCAIGSNALITHNFDRPINVTGYNPQGPVNSNLCTFSAALAYNDATTGKSVILVVHQAIYIPDLNHNLLSTMQLRLNDVTVNDVPRFLTEKPTPLTHALVIPTDDFMTHTSSQYPYTVCLRRSRHASPPWKNMKPFLILFYQVRSPNTTHTTQHWPGMKKP